MSGLYYVKKPNVSRYHKGPGRIVTDEVGDASLYPRPIAQRIAQIYGGIIIRAEAHIQTLIGYHRKRIAELEALQHEIESGRRTYVNVPGDLVSFLDMEDEIRAMPESSLKQHLIGILEEHKALLSSPKAERAAAG